MLQLEQENKCPDCLYLKLKGRLVPRTRPWLPFLPLKPAVRQIDLYLTLNFDCQWLSLLGGRVKYGLVGGDLRLYLVNGTIPYPNRAFNNKLVPTIEKTRKVRSLDKSQKKLGASVGELQVKPTVEANAERTWERTSEFAHLCSQITTYGSNESPGWRFEVKTGEPILQDGLIDVKLATLNVTTLPCQVEARFSSSMRNVRITDAEGLWPEDIHRKKLAILERAIVHRTLAPQMKPYLSKTLLILTHE